MSIRYAKDENHAEIVNNWKDNIRKMGWFDAVGDPTLDKYVRFTASIEFAVISKFPGVSNPSPHVIFKHQLDEDWFHNARKGRFDHIPQIAREKINSTFVNQEKNEIYNSMMPIYRALREDFANRSIFQWIFNHSEYVAVRDSLKAVSNLIKATTGDTEQELEEAYAQHVQEFEVKDLPPLTDTDYSEKRARIEKIKKEISNTKNENKPADAELDKNKINDKSVEHTPKVQKLCKDYFDPSFCPPLDLEENINYTENYENIVQFYEDYVKDNADLPEDAREVFMEKMELFKNVYELINELKTDRTRTDDQKIQEVQIKREEMIQRTENFAKSKENYKAPEFKSLEENRIIAEFFRVDFRPEINRIGELVNTANGIGAQIKGDKSMIPEDAKRAFGINMQKIKMMYKAPTQYHDATYKKLEDEFSKKYPDYKIPPLKKISINMLNKGDKSKAASVPKAENLNEKIREKENIADGLNVENKDNVINEGVNLDNAKNDVIVREPVVIESLSEKEEKNLSPKLDLEPHTKVNTMNKN